MSDGRPPNIYSPDFDELREAEGFRARRARIGRRLGTERIGFSLWEVPPGERAYPYHFHLSEEEVLVVLEGTPTLRDPDGGAPDIIIFPDSGKLGVAERGPRDDGRKHYFGIADEVGYWDGEASAAPEDD